MRNIKRNNRVVSTPKWAIHACLILVGLMMVLSGTVQSQQTGRGRTPTPKCALPAAELESLITLLDDIEQQPLQEESAEDAEDEEESVESLERLNPQCTRELNRLRHTVDHLQRRYHELKQSTTTGIDERRYKQMENRYAQQKQKLTTQLEELAKQVNPQHQSQLSKLRRKIIDTEKQLNSTISEVSKERQRNANHFIQLVANNIRNNNVRVALNNFNTLTTYNTDPYGAIVQKLFQSGGASNTQAMLYFLRQVDFKHRPVSGYDALVDALIERSALRGPDAIELLKHIQCIIFARDGPQQTQALALLKKFKSSAQ